MKIDFHVHTRASFDCESDPSEIVSWAVKKGLDAIFVTEHDSTGGYEDLKRAALGTNLQILPGVEFTVRRGTHYLVFFTPELPLPKNDLDMIREVHRRGGLVGVPHPYRSDTGLIYNQVTLGLYEQKEVSEILSAVDMLEVFNAKSYPKENEQANILSDRYPNLRKIAGSDSHHPSTVGAAHVEIKALKSGSSEELRHAMRVLPSEIVTLPELNLSSSSKKFLDAVEGFRKLSVKVKPVIPVALWKVGQAAYKGAVNRLACRRARKSLVK
jgi:predicted metal-dependent phosphoesterase TrpH